jgi:hypothetical protein
MINEGLFINYKLSEIYHILFKKGPYIVWKKNILFKN